MCLDQSINTLTLHYKGQLSEHSLLISHSLVMSQGLSNRAAVVAGRVHQTDTVSIACCAVA